MGESIQDSVTRLLRYQRAPEKVTKLFRNWKHNTDILPRMQSELEMLLEAYGKFEHVVYDIQGPRDDGSDILLHFRPEDGKGPPELLCFQVKSFNDLAKKDYMKELKAQRDDSFRKILGLRYYFLVLCTDPQLHRDRIRNIMAEFRSADRTEVIEPPFAYTFLHHPRTRIEALVKRTMEADDFVFRRALEWLDHPSPSARALSVFLTVKSVLRGETRFPLDQLLREPSLHRIYDELREKQEALLSESSPSSTNPMAAADDEESFWESDYEGEQVGDFVDQIAVDLETLEGDTELDSLSDNVLLRTDQMRALTAVIADALARYEYNEEQLMSYMFDLFIRD